MSDGTIILLALGALAMLIVGIVIAPILALHREARGLEKFARTMGQMKRDAERSGGNIKTEATAFKDVFKP